MFPVSCILLCLAAAGTHQHVFTYVKPWDPYRRSVVECEMCYRGDCVLTHGPRCEYYAEASKLISDDDNEDRVESETEGEGNEIDVMLFDLVDAAPSTPHFKGCIPFVSQYTDCTEENICTGCKFCSCSDEGRWICSEKQTCSPEPKLDVDHRVIGIVIEYLKRKEKLQKRRIKRSSNNIDTKQKNVEHKLTYTDISKWMYGVEPFNYKQRDADIGEILEYLKGNETTSFNGYKALNKSTFTTTVTNGFHYTTDTLINKSNNYVDLLEFNDILESWRTADIITAKPFEIINTPQNFPKHRSEEIPINDVDYIEYDPIRLIKRDTSKLETNESNTTLQINTTSNNFTYDLILIDALQGLNKLTTEKQKELEDLLNIQNNLLNIAKSHNIAIDINSTTTHDNYNKHHIAIYKLDTFENCVAKVKQDICNAIKNVIEAGVVKNSSDIPRDLKFVFNTIRNYVFRENNKTDDTKSNVQSSQESDQNPRRHFDADRYEHFDPIVHMGNILVQMNKTPANPLQTISQHTRKILKRVIKQLYFDDLAVIDFIIHETYYDFDSYMENIGNKWNKMMQNVIDSEVHDTIYKVKLLHMTLRADISKMENMIILLDFARNRRMTIANGVTIDKSISRIQNNLQLIDNHVQKILKFKRNKKTRQASSVEKNKPTKKKSILQKLKKMFQNSKNDIKDLLRKRFPKSEIIKEIAKKKMDELEKQKMLEYQETMRQWHDNLNTVPGRDKRSAWGLRELGDRIKSIIPGYLKRKVKPAVTKKRSTHKTRTSKVHGRKKNKHTRLTTIKTTTVSRNSIETLHSV